MDRDFLNNQLDRTLAFIGVVDGRATFLFGIISAQIAVAAAYLEPISLQNGWIVLALVTFGGFAAFGIWKIYWCLKPDLAGNEASLIYFQAISKLPEAEYHEKSLACSADELDKDLRNQIWRNSKIVSSKFGNLKAAIISTLLGSIPWAALVFAASIQPLSLSGQS